MSIPTRTLYLLDQGQLQAVLLPDENGVPQLIDPQPVVTRAEYLSAEQAERGDFDTVQTLLNSGRTLLMYTSCPDGPPRRSALCFTFQKTVPSPWRNRTIHHGASLHQYEVTTTRGSWSWLSEQTSKPGYVLTGVASDSTLWRVARIEADPFSRSVFTLSPVRVTAGLPLVDFSSLEDPILMGELEAQYEELGQAITQHAYREVVTKAKNIIEGVIAYKLKLLDGKDRLTTGLTIIRRLLEDPATRETCGWTDLQYHVAHKVRLLHGQTHATTRSSLRPELALTAAEDLNFLLRDWQLIG